MAQVSLDGLLVEKPHALALDEAARRIELAVEDLRNGSLSAYSPSVSRPAPGRFVLQGRGKGTSFDADITIQPAVVRLELKGAIELSALLLLGAGGAAGVRKRVRAELQKALDSRLGGEAA